jgi:membrane protein YqaA with SNARE-associated domain
VTTAYVLLAALTVFLLAAVATVLGSAASHYAEYRRQRTFQRFLTEFRSQMRRQAIENRRPETEQGLDLEGQPQGLRDQRALVLGALMGTGSD